MSQKSRNFVGPKYRAEDDKNLFSEDDVLEPLLPQDRSIGHLLVRCGVFETVGDAFKAGFNKLVPTGWDNYHINDLEITIWNPKMTAQEAIEHLAKNGVNNYGC